MIKVVSRSNIILQACLVTTLIYFYILLPTYPQRLNECMTYISQRHISRNYIYLAPVVGTCLNCSHPPHSSLQTSIRVPDI